jgi:DNA-binding CsgD family transcriptional regulator
LTRIRGAGRDLREGAGIAFFVLFLPLMAPHALMGLDHGAPFWTLRGLAVLPATLGGACLSFLLDRFAARAKLGIYRVWACALLMLLTLLLLFLPLSAAWGVVLLFFVAFCVSALLLPSIQRVYTGGEPARALFCALFVGGGLSVAGHSVLTRLDAARPQFSGVLSTILAGALLTGGMAFSRYKQEAARASEPEPQTALPAHRGAYGAAALAVCIVSLLLLALRLYAGQAADSLPAAAPPLTLCLSAGLLWFVFLREKRGLALYLIALAGVLGGVLSLAGLSGPAVFCADLFCLQFAIAGLGALLADWLYSAVPPVNRPCAVWACLTAILALLWVTAAPDQLLWVGWRLQDALTAILLLSFFLLLQPLLSAPVIAGALAAKPTEPAPPQTANAGAAGGTAPESAPPPAGPEDELPTRLTMTEKKVYELILLGLSNQQMADALFVSINTIKFHIKNILNKAGVTKRSQLLGRLVRLEVRERTEDGTEGR